jgi:hypothetical protein
MKRRTLARALTGAHELGMRGYEEAKKVRRPKIQSGPVQLKTAQPITTPTLPFARRRP